MLQSIRVLNFKGLEDTGALNIKPITILIGPNSSGKSSLIQPLLMFKQTVDSRDVTSPLVVNGSYVKLSSFESFIFQHDIKKQLTIELGFSAKPTPFFIENKILRDIHYHLRTSFIYNKSKKRIELASSSTTSENGKLVIERVKLKRGVKYQARLEYGPRDSSNSPREHSFTNIQPTKFYGVSLKALGKRISMKAVEARRTIINTNRRLEELIENINYIGPLRDNPRSFYVSGGELRKDVGLKGEFASDVLWTQTQGRKRSNNLLSKVNFWIKKFNLGSAVKIKPIGRHSGFFQVVITNPQSKIDATINDVGFGVSQVLPLIIEGFYSNAKSTLLIEQPEIHLHPKVQGDIADLFIELIKDGRRIIIETHSEHLISRLARRIAEGDAISKDDVAIYYFKAGPQGASVSDIAINNLGQFENWPEGFFEENYTEALIHSKIIAEKASLSQQEK